MNEIGHIALPIKNICGGALGHQLKKPIFLRFSALFPRIPLVCPSYSNIAKNLKTHKNPPYFFALQLFTPRKKKKKKKTWPLKAISNNIKTNCSLSKSNNISLGQALKNERKKIGKKEMMASNWGRGVWLNGNSNLCCFQSVNFRLRNNFFPSSSMQL